MANIAERSPGDWWAFVQSIVPSNVFTEGTVLLRFAGRINPLTFYRKAWTAPQFAFVSQSSGAALPLSRQAAVNLGMPRGYASFAVPLGTTTKMDGCAVNPILDMARTATGPEKEKVPA